MFRVLYHAPCPDGAAAALMASIYMERAGVDPLDQKKASWHPMKVFQAPEEQFDLAKVGPEDEIFVLDYSGSVDFASTLAVKSKRVTVLDHHLTAVTAFGRAMRHGGLPENLVLELDMQRSGATVALDYFAKRLRIENPPVRPLPALGAPDVAMEAPGDAATALVTQASQDQDASPPVAPVRADAEAEAAVEDPAPEATAPVSRAAKRRKKKATAKSRGSSLGPIPKAEPRSTPKAVSATPVASGAEPPREVEESGPVGGGYGAFLGEDASGISLLRFIRYIEDADLYRFWLQDSRAFASGFGGLRLNYDVRGNPGIFKTLRNLDHKALIQTGSASVEKDQQKIDEELSRCFIVHVPEVGVRCLGIRTNWPDLRSSIGHALAEKSLQEGLQGMGVIAYSTPELEQGGYIKVSLRAMHGTDTLKLSEKFGGGGHKAASSCNVLKFVFDSWCEDAKA